jgi:hypothetical protein
MCKASTANYSRQLLKVIEKVDGLVTSDEEVGYWDYYGSSPIKSGRCGTRSDIVLSIILLSSEIISQDSLVAVVIVVAVAVAVISNLGIGIARKPALGLQN